MYLYRSLYHPLMYLLGSLNLVFVSWIDEHETVEIAVTHVTDEGSYMEHETQR